MNRILLTFVLLAMLGAPLSALSHATPVESIPASSENLIEAPSEVRIRFSERIEKGASRIVVKDEDGEEIQSEKASVDQSDAHVLFVPIAEHKEGTYFVTWSVVSSDDGHFTKGGFAYFVGEESGAAPIAPQVAVVQISAVPEAAAIFVELLGNSLLLGVLVLFAFLIRPQVGKMDERAKDAAFRVHSRLAAFGILLAIGGALVHVILKTSELASLSEISFLDALPLYVATVSGSATLFRAGAIVIFGLLFFFRRQAIRVASRITLSEGALVLCLGVFAFFRSLVSHATANPFYPELSIFINFLHLIAKDLSAGILAALCVLLFVRSLRPHMPEFLRRGFIAITLAFLVLVPTATYIVWLHLKDFANLTTTLWGERFLPLSISGMLATLLLAYHVIGRAVKPQFVARYLSFTLPAELATGVLIVFFSSLVIITSPPLEAPPGYTFRTESHGATITLAPAPNEDGMARITLSNQSGMQFSDPVIQLDGEEGFLVEAKKRFPGGYVFKTATLAGDEAHTLTVVAAQSGGYDARAEFSVTHTDLFPPTTFSASRNIGGFPSGTGVNDAQAPFTPPETTGHGRDFDTFTFVMISIGLLGFACTAFLFRFSLSDSWEDTIPGSLWRGTAGFLVLLLVASQLMGLASYAFGNSFKKECIADGNMWHLMLPARDGIPTSAIPAEGCMALSGSFHIADAREYRYLKNPGESHVVYATNLEKLTAGVPVSLDFSIQNESGEPVLLSIIHERYVHAIVVSSDMREFWHVHPDDYAPLTSEEIRMASFSIPFAFPRSGTYLIAFDYANGLKQESKFVTVKVGGSPTQDAQATTYPEKGMFEGYEVSIDSSLVLAGQPANLVYSIKKDGKNVTNLEPYLGAAMHVAVVKNDLSEFIHTHGEVHPPGMPIPPPSKTTVHNHTPPPPRFGPPIDAHPIFPSRGLYTVFGQFKHEGEVILTKFTAQAE